MTPEIMRQYLAEQAPEFEVVEPHTTEYISREWKVLPAQVANTLTLRVRGGAIIVVTCGDSRLDNRKVKEELGGKGHMMPGSCSCPSLFLPAGYPHDVPGALTLSKLFGPNELNQSHHER